MASNKAQEMSIQTVVVLILIMIVLVVVIAFAVPQITNLFSGLGGVGSDVNESLSGLASCKPSLTGCPSGVDCTTKTTEATCIAFNDCCRWSSI